jgi:hypothetical protein
MEKCRLGQKAEDKKTSTGKKRQKVKKHWKKLRM